MPTKGEPIARRLTRLAPEHYEPAMQAAAETFAPGNRAGVFGVAIQRKRVHGLRRRVLTLAAFVERKEIAPGEPVRAVRFRHGDRWFELVPDVVATGSPAAAAAGETPRFSGLHAGAALRIDAGRGCTGGVACLLGRDDGPTHLLTAGHVFPEGAERAPVLAAASATGSAERVGVLEHNLLDGRAGLDVALVELTDAGVRMARISGTASRLPRLGAAPFASGLVESTWLRVFLATTGDYKADLEGERRFNRFAVESGCRPTHLAKDVITTGFAHNVQGNSGTVLMTDDRSGSVRGQAVGVAIGFAGDLSLHEPLDRAIDRLRDDTGKSFRIWSQS